jgi:membrane protease YdiL (CAAX protease family)
VLGGAAGAPEGEVIAAAGSIDQSATAASADDAAPGPTIFVDALMLLAAAAGGTIFIRRRWGRLHGLAHPHAIGPLDGFVLLLAIAALAQVGARAAMMLWPWTSAPPEDHLAAGCAIRAAAYAAQLPAIAVFILLVNRAKRLSADHRGIGVVWQDVGAAALWYPAVYVASRAATIIAGALGQDVSDPLAHETLRLLDAVGPGLWWAAAIGLAVVAAPIVEEVMYRGLAQRTLIAAGLPRWVGIMIASGVFAAVHVGTVPLHALPGLFALSVGLGWVYERSGRLWAAIVMHATFNAANLALAMIIAPPAA